MSRPLAVALLLFPSLALAASAPAAEPVAVPEWHVIGPFESGSREGLVHPLAGPGGFVEASPDFARTWPSALADGGRVAWKRVPGERGEDGALTGSVKIELGGVAWEAREDEWGAAAAMNVAVLRGKFELEEDALLLVDAARCSGSIGGQPFAGDPYGAGIARSVVRGRKGANDVVLVSGGFGGSRGVTFRVEPIDPRGAKVLIVEKDVLLPQLVAGRSGRGAAGIPLLNLTDSWQDVTLEITGPLLAEPARATCRLAPLAPLKAPVDLAWSAAPADRESVEWSIVASDARLTAQASIAPEGAPRRETFRSRIDGSAQEYGVRPSTRGEGPGQALIISTHGAGVSALGQVSSYGPKDGVTIVAPTNRRPFGFDWHDWGRLDFEEVLDLAKARFRPDPSRVHLTGHSMGGHGAWTLGTLHADEFATVSPSAAWASYDTYVPFTTRRSTWLGSPEINELLMRGLATGRSSVLLENLRHVPVQVLHGGKDDNVPPTQARMLTGLLERLGGRVTYVEAPNEGHWSDLDLSRPGADSVDPAIMDDFWGKHVRDAAPRRFVFATPDPDVDATRHWLRIDAQLRAASESRVEADVPDASRVVLLTRNVAGLSVSLPPALGLQAGATILIDGQTFAAKPPAMSLRRDATGWAEASPPVASAPRPNARPGGLAKALFTPFLIVIPTQGDPARCESLAQVGRLVATAWWVRGNGHAPIVRDVDVGAAERASHGLLLLGGPDLNAETARIAGGLRIVARAEGASLAGRALPGADLAAAHWQPHPESPDQRVLVLQATSPKGDELLQGLQPIAAGLGLPDFAVASPRARIAGFGGFVAAGFWAPDWSLDPSSTWLAAGVGAPPAPAAEPLAPKRRWRR